MYYTNFQNSRGNIRREEDPNPNEQPRRKRARGEQQTDEQTQNQSEQQSHPDEQQQTETGKHEQEQQQTETGKHEQDDNKHQQNEQTDEQQTETGSHDLQQQDEQGDEHPLPHPPNPPEVFPQSLTEREVNKNDTENLLCTDICARMMIIFSRDLSVFRISGISRFQGSLFSPEILGKMACVARCSFSALYY